MKEITTETVRQYFSRLVSWAAGMERAILEQGYPLLAINRKDAETIGIRQIDNIRIVVVQNIFRPSDRDLSELIQQTEVISPQTSGMTFGHGIMLKNGAYDRQLIAHELVHVLQYERFGGIEQFLQEYIREAIPPAKYGEGPLEQEATQLAASLFRGSLP